MSGQVVAGIHYNQTGTVTAQTLPPGSHPGEYRDTLTNNKQHRADFTQILTIIYPGHPYPSQTGLLLIN